MRVRRSSNVLGVFLIACCVVLGAGVLVATAGGGTNDLSPALEDGSDDHWVAGSSVLQAGAMSGSAGDNLLDNPNCEGGEDPPDGWETVDGAGAVGCWDDGVSPEYGDLAFSDFEGGGATAIVEQAVTVEGGETYELAVLVGTTDGGDSVDVKVWYPGEGSDAENPDLHLQELPDSQGEWEEHSDTTTAPAGASEAIVRIEIAESNVGYSYATVDRITFAEFSDAPTAFDIEGVEIGIQHTLDPAWTLFDDDFAEDEDDLGTEPAELVSFGGGDLGGDVTTHDAGETVSMAGGDLTVNADGSFSLVEPTQTGTYEFDYRIEKDDGRNDDATVTIEVRDHELENPACLETNGGDAPPGWTSVGGDSMTCLHLADDDDTDHTAPVGDYAFASQGFDASAEQTVWVVPGEEYTIEGLVGTDPGDDYGEVEVEYLDENGAVIPGEGVTLSGLQSATDDDFDRFVDSSVAPANAQQAVVRLTKVHEEGQWAGVYFDDLAFVPGEPEAEPVNAYDVDDLAVGIERTLAPEESLFTLGDQSDDLGFPQADLVSFGGGDLGGDVTTHDAGETVGLAGGDLTVNADGTLTFAEPTQTGTYEFDYRIENADDHDDATVRIQVRDHELLNPDCSEGTDYWTDASPGESTMSCFDPSNEGQQNAPSGEEAFGDSDGAGDYASLEQTAPVQGEYTYELSGFVGTDDTLSTEDYGEVELEYLDEDGEVISGEGATLTDLRSGSNTEFEEFTVVAPAPEDAIDAVVRITAHQVDGTHAEVWFDDLSLEVALATINGTVVDEATGEPIEGATVELEAGGVLIDDAVTGPDGTYEFEELDPDTTYDLSAEAAGYHDGDETVVVEGVDETQDIGLAGSGSVSGTVEDVTLDGIPAVEVTVAGEQGEYTATTDENGEYTVDGVAGTGEEYTVSADPGSWNENSTTVTVGDGEAAQADLTLTGPRTNTVEAHDRLFEHAGDEYRIGNAAIVIEHSTYGAEPTFGEATVTTGSDGSSVDVALPTMPTHLAPGGILGDDELRYTASADGYEPHTNWESLDFDISLRVTIGGNAEVSGTVIDEGTGDPIEDATIEIEYPSGEAVVFEDATDADGAYTIEDVPGTGEEYEITVSVDGYESNATALAVGDGESVEHDVELSGTASVSGSVEDTTFETGVEGVQIAVENGAGTYTAETDENGEYTVEGVAGTGETYTVRVDQEGWQDESTTETIGDGEDVTDVDFEITGDASDDITLRDWVTDEPLEGATVRIEHETFGVAEDAFTADGDGNMEIVVPGGFTYSYTFSHPGYDAAEIPLRSFDPGASLSANYVLGGNAEITGQIAESKSNAGVEGVTVTAENGAGAYTATTDEHGAYTVENVPGGHDYDVTIEAGGYETAVEFDESVTDGGTHTVDAELTGNAAIEGTVEDEVTGAPIENADVTVVYPSDDEFTVEDATDSAGEFTVDEIPGTGEEYTIAAHATSYEAGDTTVTVADGALADAGVIGLGGNASVSGTVYSLEFGAGMPGVEVTVSGSTGEYVTTTDENGEYTVEGVPGTGETYTVAAERDGTNDDSMDVTVGDSESVSDVDFHLSGNQFFEADVFDSVSGNHFENADDRQVTITVEHDTFGETSATVSIYNDQHVTSMFLPGGEEYDVTYSKPGYHPVTFSDADVDNPDRHQVVFEANAIVSGTVTDETLDAGIPDVEVSVSGTNDEYTATTNENGAYTISHVPGTGEAYEITVSADGYVSNTTTVVVGDGEFVEHDVALSGDASVSGTVSDTTFETELEGIDVSITGELGSYTAETDENGEYTVENVPGTGETYSVSVDPTGWDGETEPVTVGDGEDVTGVDFEITGDASDEVTLRDATTDAPLEGASVVIEHDTFGVAVDTLTTDGDGIVTVEVPGGFEYMYTFSKVGYDAETVDSGELLAGEHSSQTAVLAGNAEISGQITDSESSAGIEGATVTAENGAGAYTVTTDEHGEYTVGVPGGHDYDVTVEADGYETVVESDESVADGATHTVDAELTGTATISGTVTDETFGAEIEGAEVEISAGQTYTVETNQDGEYTATVGGTGEQYLVSVTHEGWIGEDRSVALGDGEVETGFDFELDGDASDEVTVGDAVTGGPIDGATVVVEHDTFGESAPFETGSDGVVEVTPLPGGFTYEYTIEADGYEADEITDVWLAPGESGASTHELWGNATITGTVTDEASGVPIEGATVTAENGAGSYEAIADANGAYVIENVPATGDTYDLHAEAVGYNDATVTQTVAGDVEDVAIEVEPRFGTIEGVVSDDGGDPIEGATVTIEDDYGVSQKTATDADGEYAFEEALAEVEQTMLVEASGHASNGMTVSVGEGETVTANVTLETLSAPTRPKLVEIVAIDAPSEVETGEEITVTVELENIGDHDRSSTVELRLGAGEEDATQEVRLAGGESKTLTFEFTAPNRASLYLLTITTEYDSSSTIMSVSEATPATPTVTPTATPTVTPTATPTVSPTATPTATPTDDEAVPGFGVVLAVLALLAVALLATRRR